MKRLIRNVAITTFSLWVASQVGGGISYAGFLTLLMAGAALAVINLLIKPVINLLLLPLNIATLGLFRWVTAVVTLFLALKVVPQFSVTSFSFAGWMFKGVVFPAFSLGFFPGLVVVALIVSVVSSVLFWLVH